MQSNTVEQTSRQNPKFIPKCKIKNQAVFKKTAQTSISKARTIFKDKEANKVRIKKTCT